MPASTPCRLGVCGGGVSISRSGRRPARDHRLHDSTNSGECLRARLPAGAAPARTRRVLGDPQGDARTELHPQRQLLPARLQRWEGRANATQVQLRSRPTGRPAGSRRTSPAQSRSPASPGPTHLQQLAAVGAAVQHPILGQACSASRGAGTTLSRRRSSSIHAPAGVGSGTRQPGRLLAYAPLRRQGRAPGGWRPPRAAAPASLPAATLCKPLLHACSARAPRLAHRG